MLALVVLVLCATRVRLVQRATVGRFLTRCGRSPLGADSVGINLSRPRSLVFALSAALAGLGGALYGSLQQSITPADFNYQFSLIFVVVVVTTGAARWRGRSRPAWGSSSSSSCSATCPAGSGTGGLAVVLFALGALTYAAHPEGVVEYQKRRGPSGSRRAGRFPDGRRGRRSGGWPRPALMSTRAVPAGDDRAPRRAVPGPDRPLLAFGGVSSARGDRACDVSRCRARSWGSSGRTGPGKTTLFNCVGGSARPDAGHRSRSTGSSSTGCRLPTGPARDRAGPSSGSRCSPR